MVSREFISLIPILQNPVDQCLGGMGFISDPSETKASDAYSKSYLVPPHVMRNTCHTPQPT